MLKNSVIYVFFLRFVLLPLYCLAEAVSCKAIQVKTTFCKKSLLPSINIFNSNLPHDPFAQYLFSYFSSWNAECCDAPVLRLSVLKTFPFLKFNIAHNPSSASFTYFWSQTEMKLELIKCRKRYNLHSQINFPNQTLVIWISLWVWSTNTPPTPPLSY